MSDSQTASLLDGFPVITDVPILWGDEDSFAHVNNVTYLRWCETGRVEYMHKVGLFPDVPPKGVGPILASVTCHYRKALTYPDHVAIATRVSKIGNSSIRMDHRVVSRSLGVVAAEAETTIVCLDYASGQTVRVPEATRKAIAQLQGWPPDSL